METIIYPFDFNILLKLAKFETLALCCSLLFFFMKNKDSKVYKSLFYVVFTWLFMIAWVQLQSTEYLMSADYALHPLQAITRFLIILFSILILKFSRVSFSPKQISLLLLSLALFSIGQTLLLHAANPVVSGLFVLISFYFYKKKRTSMKSLLVPMIVTAIFFSLYLFLDMHSSLGRIVFFSHILIASFVLPLGAFFWDRLESHPYRFYYFFYLVLFSLHLTSSTLAFLIVYRDMALCFTIYKVLQFFMVWFLLSFSFSQFINSSKGPNSSSILLLLIIYCSVFYSIPTAQSFVYLAYNALPLLLLFVYYICDDQDHKKRENIVLNIGSLVLASSGYLIMPEIYHERLLGIFLMLVLTFILSLISIVRQKLKHMMIHPIFILLILFLIPVQEIEKMSKQSYKRLIDVRDDLKHLIKMSNSDPLNAPSK
ncbi:hypothetical protein MJH12_09090 [bacterium]|nr:hypothetical protein [bacterium]